jgi:hypothetical protein
LIELPTGAKALTAAGVTGGVVLAVTGGVQPDPTAMMYSLALAVIGLATKSLTDTFGRGRTIPALTKAEWDEARHELKSLAKGIDGAREDSGTFRRELGDRMDRIDGKIENLAHAMSSFREQTVGGLADHGARITGLEHSRRKGDSWQQ